MKPCPEGGNAPRNEAIPAGRASKASAEDHQGRLPAARARARRDLDATPAATEGLTAPGVESEIGNGDCGRDPKGLFIAIEGIDGAGKTTAARIAADVVRSRGKHAVAVTREDVARCPAYVAGHMTALLNLIWDEPPDAPYLDLGDEHWVHLQAAWYAAFARCVVTPAVAERAIVLADTWGYKFLAKLALRPPATVDFEVAWKVFQELLQPDVVVHLHADPEVAAARKSAFSGSETGNREGTPNLSAAAFTDYQARLAEIIESFASKEGWVCVDTSSLSAAQTGSVVADIAEHYLYAPTAARRRAYGAGLRRVPELRGFSTVRDE
jgi:thymidylate kinase